MLQFCPPVFSRRSHHPSTPQSPPIAPLLPAPLFPGSHRERRGPPLPPAHPPSEPEPHCRRSALCCHLSSPGWCDLRGQPLSQAATPSQSDSPASAPFARL